MKSIKSWILLILIILLVASGAYFVMRNENALFSNDDGASSYQAVFLSNGQVYFGVVGNENRQFVVLKDIYYIQVQDQLDALEGETSNQDISLVKLGGELHGPTDEMRINRDHVVLIEDLRNSSNVVEAISQYKNSGTKSE